jgi:hypothetical protein
MANKLLSSAEILLASRSENVTSSGIVRARSCATLDKNLVIYSIEHACKRAYGAWLSCFVPMEGHPAVNIEQEASGCSIKVTIFMNSNEYNRSEYQYERSMSESIYQKQARSVNIHSSSIICIVFESNSRNVPIFGLYLLALQYYHTSMVAKFGGRQILLEM